MSKKSLKKWFRESVERSEVESELRMAIVSTRNEVSTDPSTRNEVSVDPPEPTLSEAECQALKDLRDSIQREIDLFCSS